MVGVRVTVLVVSKPGIDAVYRDDRAPLIAVPGVVMVMLGTVDGAPLP